MAAETLNFGPEWLRALSSGGSVASPPTSPAMPKYKLADYRYGREEMLALYIKEDKVPEELQDKEFAAVLQEEPLQPLALEPLTEEEQRNFSLSVNSVAVLRLMGKGAAPPLAGASRGRGSTRSRGRGRGDSCFYQRSIEEGDGAFGRNPREIQRSQSWDDRGERRFEKSARRDGARSGFEEGGAGPRKEHARSDSENWRSLREEQEEEEEGSWRLGAGPRRDGDRWRSTSPDGGPRSAGWREHGERRRKFDFDLRGERGGCGEEEGRGGGGSSHLRRCRGLDGFDDDKDGLPEWCLDDEDEEMGTFDASGAFLPLKKGPKDPIPEEQELDFQGLEEEEESSEGLDEERPEAGGKEMPPLPPPEKSSSPSPLPTLGPLWGTNGESDEAVEKELPTAEGDDMRGIQLSPGVGSPPAPPGDLEDEEGLKHLQQEAEKLVASLQDSSLEEEQFTAAMQTQGLRHSTAATALPLSHGAARKWFYKDPQGEIQGPFTTQEMAEWFQAGYFSMSLLVKRGCDEGFQPLGEVIKMWGRVPFAPGPSPPPLLGNMDQERLKKQQELAAAALYQQLQHQQFLQLVGSRQLPPCSLREKAAMGDLSPPQQQQLTTFLQQLQALKTPRGGDQNLLPTISRSLSVPDSSPLWDVHTSASSQSGGEASLWDIPINSSTQGPILEQLQLQHKFQERREAELRAKREEEERKRREEKRRQQQQEEHKRRQEEEELFRRKQGLSMKTLLELQLESERQLHKPPVPREPPRAQAPNHRSQLGGLGAAPLNQWVSEAGPLWGGPDKSGGSGSGSLGLWEDTLKSSGSLARSLGLKNSRSSPSLSDSYSHLSGRPVRKKTEEEEKLLKLLQGIPRPQDGFTQWCEQMLHTLSTTGSLDVPMAVAILKEVESPYDVHDYIRSCLGDTLEAKEFAKQFLERRAKQKASQQRQHQQQEVWLSSASLQTAFQANHSTKLGPGEGTKAKRRALMLHSDPSILGYSLHGPSGEIESVDDY
ncbi:PERQ amino acid-rich with GYF domain-containing protein 1 [Fukomys damarensis]|uniref:PERQ amino acid-rich with GYF domain-containing protein 1 n=1 Tax=Fukomys damarensis TaxID=885580 RepID=A0A091E2T9_FUKDA|nr:PERQ amino acid-rich with GYF domain-containing protein 1 [Fukomys damarensis]